MAVLNVDLACNRNRKDEQGNYPCDFFSVSFWGKTAETVAQHCGKGDTIIATGRMESRKYTDKNGNNRIAWDVQADGFEFCQKSKRAEQNAPAEPSSFQPDIEVESDEAPF